MHTHNAFADFSTLDFLLCCCISFDPNLIVSVSGEINALAQPTNLAKIEKKKPEYFSIHTIFGDKFIHCVIFRVHVQ